MRKPIVCLPLIGKDMDNLQAESLIYEVRCYRYRGFEPTLYLSRSDFEQLADFWSCFYTTSRAKVPQDGKLVVWLKRLFRVKVKEKLTFYQISDDALIKFRAMILEREAIPFDGRWTDIAVIGEAGAHGNND